MGIEAEIEAQFAGALEIEHELDRFAAQIRDEVRERTPVFDPKKDRRDTPGIGEPEDLRNSIVVDPVHRPGHRRVTSDDPKVYWAELGAKHFPEVAMFAQVAALHGGTGPIIDEGVQHAQSKLRDELERLAKLGAEGALPASIAAQKLAVERARMQRSAAFKAARGGGRRRGRR